MHIKSLVRIHMYILYVYVLFCGEPRARADESRERCRALIM